MPPSDETSGQRGEVDPPVTASSDGFPAPGAVPSVEALSAEVCLVGPLAKELAELSLPARELAMARVYAETQHAENTVTAYGYDWRAFTRYCEERGQDPWKAKPAAVATYLAWMVDT